MLKCSKEAFAKCPTRHLCGSPSEATFAEGSECDKFNQRVVDQPLTNADRIRAMSDEELATAIIAGRFGFDCDVCPERNHVKCTLECARHCTEWLQQPAKEELGK